MHAVALVFDFVEPLVAVRRFLDKLRQLRPYPVRQGGGLAADPVFCRPRHSGSEKGVCAPGHAPLYAWVSRGGPWSPYVANSDNKLARLNVGL